MTTPQPRPGIRLLLILLLALLPTTVWAGGFQPVESIREAAVAALGSDAEAEATLDPALRMPRCAGPLEARPSTGTTVEVSCPDGWRLYVPVRLHRSQTVLVLGRGVAAGETIAPDMLVPETRDAARIVGAALSDPAAAVGRVARRSLSAGTLLSARDLIAPRLVRRGDIVALISGMGGLEVRMSGRALADAGENERVSVENLSSRRVVQGTVAADGAVVVAR